MSKENVIGVTRATSFAVVGLPIMLDDRIDTSALAVYTALCSFANGERTAYPSYKQIMKRSKLKSRATLSKKIKELMDFGYIVKTNKYKKNSKEKTVNNYIIFDYPSSIDELQVVQEMNYPSSRGEL